MELKVLKGDASERPAALSDVRLVRQVKLPTVDRLIIRDFGKQVDPDCIKSRDLDDVKPGGLGVHLIKSIMDEVKYRRHEEGGMELRMSKFITDPEPEQTEE